MKFLKIILRNFVGQLTWERLGQAKQEFKWRRLEFHCDRELIGIFNKYLNFKNGFYVDVGANDGRASSNTFHLEKKLGWSGILIEPIMHLHFRSRQIRSTKNRFFCCALVSENYEKENVEMLYANLMSVSPDTSTFDTAVWSQFGAEFLPPGEYVQKTWSPARTLNSILLESGCPSRIDFLSIDTEGSEFEILRDFHFSKYEIAYILIESKLDSPAVRLLLRNHYRILEHINQNILLERDYSSPNVNNASM